MHAGHVLFAHVAARPDDELDLAPAALLIAEAEYPGLDVAHYVSMLDAMADTTRLHSDDSPEGLFRSLNRHLFGELGFRGNEEDYYDPRNSFLNEVIDRRVGIPITLSLVYMEVGRRAGLEVEGIAFPGHFLVRLRAGGETLLLDPYHRGSRLDREELEERLLGAFGEPTELSSSHLQLASKRQILSRMLNNLRSIYRRNEDQSRELDVLERLAVLNPDDERVVDAVETLRRNEIGGN